jgi:deoxycytidylate deaminase
MNERNTNQNIFYNAVYGKKSNFFGMTSKIILSSFQDIKRIAEKKQVCKRKAVGCKILEFNLQHERIEHFVAINGPSGPKNKCSNIKGACGCSHAEPRAIMQYLKKREYRIKPAYVKTIMLVTFSSCVNCANIIIDSGVIDAVGYEILAEHWAVEPKDAKSMLDRSLIHFTKAQISEDSQNLLIQKILLRK